MSILTVQLFGCVRLAPSDGPIRPHLTAKAQTLLIQVCLAPQLRLSRQKAARLIWPDFSEARARKALSTEVWRLQSAMNQIDCPALQKSSDEIGFALGCDISIDANEFASGTDCVGHMRPENANETNRSSIRSALRLYTADLGEDVDDESLILPREILRARRDAAFIFLMEAAISQKDWIEAIVIGRCLLALDPLQENVHRKLIRCYLMQGNRPLALRQYAELEAILSSELNTRPMQQTQALIMDGFEDFIRTSDLLSPSPDIQGLLRDVDDIQHRLSQMRQLIAGRSA